MPAERWEATLTCGRRLLVLASGDAPVALLDTMKCDVHGDEVVRDWQRLAPGGSFDFDPRGT